MGNNGHFGTGIFTHSQAPVSALIKRQWATEIIYDSRLSVEYLFPANEKRFYIEKNNPEEFKTHNFNDPNQATENLAFIEQEFANRVYMIALNTRVQPGIIFHWVSKLCHQGPRWGWALGGDFWLQSADRLGKISPPDNPEIKISRFDISKATPYTAYRSRFFIGGSYRINRPNKTWLISLNLDNSYANVGIGEDYTLFLKIEHQF